MLGSPAPNANLTEDMPLSPSLPRRHGLAGSYDLARTATAGACPDPAEATGLSGFPVHDFSGLLHHHGAPALPPGRCRIVLIRHGQPDIALTPRTDAKAFAHYIEDYEAAGLAAESLPPPALTASLSEVRGALASVFCSDRPRAMESAARLLPAAERFADPLFAEAPLASPPLPLLRLKVTQWAVLSRGLWYLGYHPQIEGPRRAGARAAAAAAKLIAHAEQTGAAVLVAHGYFNFMIGRRLARLGYHRTGTHKATFWNAVLYDRR